MIGSSDGIDGSVAADEADVVFGGDGRHIDGIGSNELPLNGKRGFDGEGSLRVHLVEFFDVEGVEGAAIGGEEEEITTGSGAG